MFQDERLQRYYQSVTDQDGYYFYSAYVQDEVAKLGELNFLISEAMERMDMAWWNDKPTGHVCTDDMGRTIQGVSMVIHYDDTPMKCPEGHACEFCNEKVEGFDYDRALKCSNPYNRTEEHPYFEHRETGKRYYHEHFASDVDGLCYACYLVKYAEDH